MAELGTLRLRDAFAAPMPNVATSTRFAVKWGNSGAFTRERAAEFLEELERMWDAMTGVCAFDQSRGWISEKRGSHLMNVYITDTGLVEPGAGCYLGGDPENVHFISTTDNYQVLAHELGHLAEMGTMGFINNAKVGWTWEAVSNFFTWWFFPDSDPHCIVHYLDRHQSPLDNFETRYQTWFFFKYLTERFGDAFVGRLWSTAVQVGHPLAGRGRSKSTKHGQDELPFEAIQRCLREGCGASSSLLFADLLMDFVSRTAAWDFHSLGDKFRRIAGDEGGWRRLAPVVACGPEGCYVSAPRSKLCWFGFEVVDLRALLLARVGQSDPAVRPPHWRHHGRVCYQGLPHPAHWRAMLVVGAADGSYRRWPEGWDGHSDAPQAFTVCSTDREVLLVLCPAARHDDEREPPNYTINIQMAAQDWDCKACTFVNTGADALLMSCSVCGTPAFA